jgi:hypothetical protein
MYKLEQLSLTEEDIKTIKKRRKTLFWTIGIMSLVFDLFLIIMVRDELTLILIVICAFDLLMLIPIMILYKRSQKDIDFGYKFSIKGQVFSKNATTGKSRITYITVGDEKFVVTENEYKQVEVGDEIEVHYTAFTRNSVYFKKLSQTELL